jgi:hypothetical protein
VLSLQLGRSLLTGHEFHKAKPAVRDLDRLAPAEDCHDVQLCCSGCVSVFAVHPEPDRPSQGAFFLRSINCVTLPPPPGLRHLPGYASRSGTGFMPELAER